MYKYDLMISIFSNNEELVNIAKNLESTNKFVYNIENYKKVNVDAIKKSDVVIWNLDESFKDYITHLKKEVKVLLCVDKYEDAYEETAIVLLRPIDHKCVYHVLKNILNTIELEEDLNFTKICLDTAIDSMPDMFWIKTLDGIHTVLNKEFCNVVKKTKEDVTGKDHYYIWDVSKDDPNSGADICKKTEDEVIEAGHLLSFQETVKIDTGIRQLVTYKAPLYDKFGTVVGTVGIGHDITDLKNLSIELSILIDSMPYPVLLRDKERKIQKVNPPFEKVFGIKEEDVIGESYDDWVLKTFHGSVQLNSEGYKEASIMVGKEKRIVELRFDDIRDMFDNVTGQVCIFRDVTVQRKLEDQIIKNSNLDFMTKLYNRRYLYTFLAEQSEGCTLTMLSLDLDHFKTVNDTYGHKMGDEAIILAANTIRDCFKDDLVIRMGGDEFLVVKVGSVELEEVGKEAQHLLEILKKSFAEKKEFNSLSASIGIAQGVLEEGVPESLINNSDTAMYESKQKGRACYTIYHG